MKLRTFAELPTWNVTSHWNGDAFAPAADDVQAIVHASEAPKVYAQRAVHTSAVPSPALTTVSVGGEALPGTAVVPLHSGVVAAGASDAVDGASIVITGDNALSAPGANSWIVWEDEYGQALLWGANGGFRQSESPVGGANGADWQVAGRDDFDGDGKLDLLWVSTSTGQAVVWLLNSDASIRQAATVGGANGSAWTVKATGDLNADGKADLIWENVTNGQVVAFLMNGAAVLSGQNIGGPQGAGWDVRGAGDLNGDGKADIVLQNRQGQAVGWLMNGVSIAAAAAIGSPVGSAMSIQGVGDINADGRADLVWQDSNGYAYGWYMNGLTVSDYRTIGGGGIFGLEGWRITDLIDFDGDGREDLLWHTPHGTSSQPELQTWLLGADGSVSEVHDLGRPFPSSTWAVVPSMPTIFSQPAGVVRFDVNGDRHADLIWSNNQGQAVVWTSNGGVVTQTNIGAANGPNWHVEGSGDLDGDRYADLVWRDSTTGQIVVYELNHASAFVTAAAVSGANGPQWHVMATGDLDGDGHDDIILQNVNTGQAVGWIMDGTVLRSAAAIGGANGADWQIRGSGDLNGDGHDDIVWQNSQGQAVVWLMDGLGVAAGAYVGGVNGANWQIEGVGDLNGDGRDDIVWQNTEGQAVVWLMNGTSVVKGAKVGDPRGEDQHIRDVADLNGDGRADIVWQSDAGQANIWTMDGTHLRGYGGDINPPTGGNWDLFF